ncbi:MAG: DEAD/DEAH box helicase [Planctomycetes bacterium]|nr:DEAD/DEAH box helicase [Planctomycetota bacterium]
MRAIHEQHPPAAPTGFPLVFDEQGARAILARLGSGEPGEERWMDLRLRAAELSLTKGFDDLISLDANNIDEYDHQIDTARRVLRDMRGRAILADEVGLGKTIEACIIYRELEMRGLARRVLILVPASLVSQWKEELETKFFQRDFHVADSTDDWDAHPKVLASMDLAKRPNHAEEILKIDYDLLVIDEAHKLKSRSTQIHKFVQQIKKKYVLLLTATPVHNDLRELFNLITLLRPGQLSTKKKFYQNFVDSKDKRKPKNPRELKRLLSQVMVRNRRGRVNVLLPPRSAHTYSVELSGAERELYDQMTLFIKTNCTERYWRLVLMTLQRALCSSSFAVGGVLETILQRKGLPQNQRAVLGRCRDLVKQIKCNSKVDAVKEIVEQTHDRVILFTDFLESQRHIADELKKDGKNDVFLFNGQLNNVQKDTVVDAFRESKGILLSTECGSEGRNLQFCNRMINYDLPWNPLRVEQRIGRIHRLGQTREVSVFNLASVGTIEEHVLKLLTDKIRMFEMVIGELDLILGNIDTRESFEETVRTIWWTAKSDDDVKAGFDDLGKSIERARKKYSRIKESETILSGIFE